MMLVCTNSKADRSEIVQAVQSLLGFGQVLGKLGMQQPHGEWHHGAWTEGRDRKGNKKQGGMRAGDMGRKSRGAGRQGDRERARDENINPSTHTDCTEP